MPIRSSDARSVIAILIGIFGFFALFVGLQTFQVTQSFFDIGVWGGFLIGIVSFIVAYLIVR